MVLMAMGGPGSQNSLFHISNLFPARRGMVITSITACLTLGFLVFYLIGITSAALHASVRTAFVAYAAVLAVALALAFCLFPDRPFEVTTRRPGVTKEQAEEEAAAASGRWRRCGLWPIIARRRAAVAQRADVPRAWRCRWAR